MAQSKCFCSKRPQVKGTGFFCLFFFKYVSWKCIVTGLTLVTLIDTGYLHNVTSKMAGLDVKKCELNFMYLQYFKCHVWPLWTTLWCLTAYGHCPSLCGSLQLGHSLKRLLLCSREESKPYRIGMTWRWVHDPRINLREWALYMKTRVFWYQRLVPHLVPLMCSPLFAGFCAADPVQSGSVGSMLSSEPCLNTAGEVISTFMCMAWGLLKGDSKMDWSSLTTDRASCDVYNTQWLCKQKTKLSNHLI